MPGRKLRFYAAAGVFALGLGGVYVALIGPTSTYVNGLLPALLVRGIGIPLFSTCATLALLSAVPQGQAGLASGTLGMARNIGTAFGVATLGVIFNRQIATALPAQLGNLPAAEMNDDHRRRRQLHRHRRRAGAGARRCRDPARLRDPRRDHRRLLRPRHGRGPLPEAAPRAAGSRISCRSPARSSIRRRDGGLTR